MKKIDITIKGVMSDLELAEYSAIVARLKVICELFRLDLENNSEDKYT